MKKPDVTQEYLRQIIRYEPETGDFFRIAKTAYCVVPGTKTSYFKSGYLQLRINAIQYPAHRLAWFYMTGEWPIDTIDHINGNTKDNRWINLRQASRAENFLNRKRYSNNTSGFKGVSWHKASRKWRARVYRQWKVMELGGFDTAEEAAAAYDNAAQSLHGKFARLNAQPQATAE